MNIFIRLNLGGLSEKTHDFIFSIELVIKHFNCIYFDKQCQRSRMGQESRYGKSKTFFSVSAVDNEIYVIGGTLADPIGSVEAYDPKTNKWVKKASMLFARAGVVSCEVDGKIYAIGGWDGQNPALGTVEEYDLSADTWTQKSDMPTPRSFLLLLL